MPITYEVLHSEGFILVTWSGDISLEDVRNYWSKIAQDEGALAIGKTISDLRNATLLFSSEEFRAAVQRFLLPLLQNRSWISAIVVSHPMQLHVASRYQGAAALHLPESQLLF